MDIYIFTLNCIFSFDLEQNKTITLFIGLGFGLFEIQKVFVFIL